ncbi:hypothetical protein TSAR_002418 [Trichomalopsis sarcophagae]|uniref:Uncharacterized protein n=1 Tax=Trichomalopsis sarcophagae TaxID=543379 RepID=A0A232EX40_9HYME|nr:hypothetical protein TSAR_002418 [Trichomalopsis sarcophagae]
MSNSTEMVRWKAKRGKKGLENKISNILNLIEKEKNIRYSGMKNAILIMGSVRSKKRNFTQFIAKNRKSSSRKSRRNTAMNTDTILPILIEDTDHNVTFVDCPAFNDDAVHDITGTYFIKNIIDSSESLKLVFTINHSAVKNNEEDTNFSLLLNHAIKLVKNLDKFKNSMALIVTNVTEVGNAEIANIANVLQNRKQNLQNIAAKQFLDNLLITDEGGNFSRIGIFKKVKKYSETNKNSLKAILHDNLKFSTWNESDFAYTIPSVSNNHIIPDLIEKINENIVLDIKNMGQEIKNHYYKQEKASLDIHNLHTKFVEGNHTFSTTKAAGMQCTNTQCLTNKITQNVISLGINNLNHDFSSIAHYEKFLEFIKSVKNDTNTIRPKQWSEGLTNMISYLNDSSKWYQFLVLLEDALSVYDVQKYINANRSSLVGLKLLFDEEKKEGMAENNINDILDTLKNIFEGILGNDERFGPLFNAFSDAKNVKLSQSKTKFLNLILDTSLKSNVSISCDDNQGVIKGKYVMLSSISSNGCERSKSIEIFALHSIYIDTDIDRTGDEVQLSIIAPRWEVIAFRNKTFTDDVFGYNSAIVERDSYRYIYLSGKVTKTRGNKSSQSNKQTSIPKELIAGNFIGLSQSVKNNEYLKIIADGGITFDSSQMPCRIRALLDFSNNNNYDQSVFNNTCKITYEHQSYSTGRCTLHPKNCYSPRDIPDGDILFIMLEEQPGVKINNTNGEIGYSGNGCKEGQNEGMNENCVEIDFERYYGGSEKWSLIEYGYYAFFSRTYSTDFDKLKSNSMVASHLPTVINHYKSYVRKNLIYDISNPLTRKFLNEIDEYDFYTTLDFVNELKDLEEQFYDLHKEVSLLPFYQSLLNRVQRYAEKLEKSGGLESDRKKILNYICTAILSKINSVNNDVVNDFSRNLPSYFDETIDKINKIQNYLDVTIRYSHYENYQQQIKDKITEVVKIIETEIIPELNSIFPDIEEKIESMISETLQKIEEMKEQREVLVKKREELASALKWRYVGLSLKIFAMFLGFLGPMGAIAGAVIGGSTMIGESLLLDDSGSLGMDKTVTLPGAVKNSITRITDEYKKKETAYKRKLYKAEEEMKKYSDDPSSEPSPTMNEIRDKISTTKVKYENVDKNGIALDQKSIDLKQKYKTELAELLEQKKTLLEAEKATSAIKVDRKLNILTHIQGIVGIAEIAVETYSKIKNNQAKINSVNDALAQVDASIGAMKNYETEIYKVIMPIGKKIEENVNNTLKNLAGLSQAAITLSGWRLKNSLRDSQIQLQGKTEGYSVQKSLSYCLEKLEYGMSVVLEMYTHIQRYEETKQLADFIANIHLRKSKDIVINNPDLNTALAQLKFITQSNLILDKYENSVNAFQQHVFPLADYYLANVHLPAIHKPNELNNSVDTIEEIIGDLKTNINKYENGRNPHFIHKYSDTEFGCDSPWPPFFVWKFDKNKPDIHKLLEGKEILLKSDVRQGINQNAIKFNKIGIRFILANEAKQAVLNGLLQKFRITMKHLGTSYYRCNDKFYKITTKDTDVISYVFKTNCSERPHRPNRIYDDIAIHEPVLSPYALWSVQLTEDGGDFNSLSEYKNEEVDLELHGKGEYMDLNLTICQGNLNKYYEEDDTVSEMNFVDISERAKRSKRAHSVRRRRSIQGNLWNQDIDRNLIATNDGCSNVKSSFINKFFNIIGNSMMLLKYWMPENDASQWFVNYNENANNEKQHFNYHNEMIPSIIQSWQKELPNGAANDESPNIEKITNDYLFCTNSNLFLLDSLIRWKNGTKHKQRYCLMRNDFNAEHAQQLAYAGYALGDS